MVQTWVTIQIYCNNMGSVTTQVESNSIGLEQRARFELFVMSEAGKPIYSFNKREDTVTLMPLCSALMNYAQKTQKEALVSIETSDNLRIHFASRSPLIIIVISEVDSLLEPETLVEQVEAQIISILTRKSLHTVFQERPTFDLKKLLYGSEKLIDAIIRLTTANKQIQSPTTKDISAIINSVISSNCKNMVFSLLFRINEPPDSSMIDFQLVSLCNHHNRHQVALKDIYIVLALIHGSKAQLASAESLWMPVCLPRFNQDAFLHSYIAFINQAKYCLAMFNVDREEFSLCQTSKSLIEEKLGSMIRDNAAPSSASIFR